MFWKRKTLCPHCKTGKETMTWTVVRNAARSYIHIIKTAANFMFRLNKRKKEL